jgi:protein O-mannosyl-transferase
MKNDRMHLVWVALGLVVGNLFIYAPVRHYGFVLYDDLQYVASNTHLTGPVWPAIRWAFQNGNAGFWMPITWLSHLLDALLFGKAAGPQHAVNVVLHVANSMLLFGVLRRMTAQWVPSAFVAGLFAVHPLHVESVAWIAERKDVLSAFFWILTLWAYTAYARRPGWKRYVLVLFPAALGLMSKPTLVTAPFALLLIDIWPLRRARLDEGQRHAWRRLILEKIPFLAMAIAVSIMTVVMNMSRGGLAGLDEFPLSVRTANAAVSYILYVRDMFWPVNLASFYPFGRLPAWQIAASALALLAVTGLVIRKARTHPYLIVGWLWYVGMLVPMIGLIQTGGQSRADRFTYIPMIGLFIAAAWGVPHVIAGWKHRRIILSLAASVLLSGFAIAARSQVRYWENALTLWQHALAVTTENYAAHTFLGLALANEGRLDEAISHYREALRIRPEFGQAHNNLGIALARQERVDEAISEFQMALTLGAPGPELHYNLGFALAQKGRTDEAIVQYNEALRLNPGYVAALTKRGDAFFLQGRSAEAIAGYMEALALQPDSAEALNNLGLALSNQGKHDEAIARYMEALRVRPDFADVHNNLGVTLAKQGRYDDAIARFNEVLRLRPNYPGARENLALALELQKQK